MSGGPVSLWQRLCDRLRDRDSGPASREQAVRLAAAILLVEMARADAEHSPDERERLRRELETRFQLPWSEAELLLQSAERSAEQSVSLHRYIDEINSGLDYPQRQSVLHMLWQVAYADGFLHRDEEHLMRRFADLLHLAHEDYIRLKLQVLGEA